VVGGGGGGSNRAFAMLVAVIMVMVSPSICCPNPLLLLLQWPTTPFPQYLRSIDLKEGISIMDLSKRTSILGDDIISTLTWLGLLRYISGQYVLYIPPEALDELAKKFPVKPPVVDSSLIHWAPLITDVKRDQWSIRGKVRPIEGMEG